MPATTSGADTSANGTAKSREHNQGNQERKYTVEQETAVLRVRRCSPTAFYEILGLEEVRTTVTDTEIKKAYRKLSLLTHPDKNGHKHADEAFKMVSRAFGVLSDTDKRAKYDRFGGDPDSRFGGGSAPPQQNPFEGFARRAPSGGAAGGRGMWEEEISPEEMFNRFFGGGGGFGGPFGGGGGIFDQGPGFVFNLGGGPGVRVHQFGGARPRMRPRARDANAPEDPPATLRSTLFSLLPLFILFVLPLLSSMFGGSEPTQPSMRFDGPKPPHTLQRTSSHSKTDYFINPAEVDGYTTHQFSKLDQSAEVAYIKTLRISCDVEVDQQTRLMQDAQGWFSQDADKMQEARELPMASCKKLSELGLRR